MPEDNAQRLVEISAQLSELQRSMAALQAELHMLRLIYELLETS